MLKHIDNPHTNWYYCSKDTNWCVDCKKDAMPLIGPYLGGYIVHIIQEAYTAGKIRKTNDCMIAMARDRLNEADVEKVIMEVTSRDEVIPTTRARASSPHNTHYVMHGTSTKGEAVYCKICSNYHPRNNEFIEWKLISFEIKQGKTE